jgi:uncharacterized protein (TIGR00369 family)
MSTAIDTTGTAGTAGTAAANTPSTRTTGPTIHPREWFRRVMEGELPLPPVAELVGMRFISADDGVAVLELQAEPRHANPMGTLHGGILCDLGDMAMGIALGSTLLPDESFTTIELKINYFKPVWRSRLTATAHIVKRTRTTCFIECDVVDDRGSLVARLGSTCMVLTGERAAGR